jgi:hypothetical protein
MGRTAGFWEQDSLFPDGQIFQPATAGIVTAGAGTLTRDGLGLLNLALAAAQTVTLDFVLTKILRFGKQDDEQQAFGSASGTGQNSLATPPGTFATNWQQSGRPPFTQAQNQVVPTKRPKGIGILSVTPIFTVSTLALTSISLGVTKTVFANGVAPAVTALLAAGTNGQPVAISANPNAVATALTVQTPITDVNAEVITELTLVLPATSTAKVYGIVWGVQFNYN